jgi:hypothetical protein
VAGLTPADPDDQLLALETRRRLLDRRVEIAARLGDAAVSAGRCRPVLILAATGMASITYPLTLRESG